MTSINNRLAHDLEEWAEKIENCEKLISPDEMNCASIMRIAANELMTPPPIHGIEAKVCADIEARQQLGMNKYGVSVEDNPLSLREWLEHAYQECLDQAIYLRRAMHQIDKDQSK